MDALLLKELNEQDQEAVTALIHACNEADGSRYQESPEQDFYYILRNDSPAETGISLPILAVLGGFLLGEQLEGLPVMELTAFTHPALRQQGLFTTLLNALRDDFRGYRFRFFVKGNASDVTETLQALQAPHEYDELMLEKQLASGIANPGDSLCSRFGEVHFSPYSGDTLYLYGLLVYDRYLRQGHGRSMLLAAEASPAGPYRRILLQVSSRNLPALRLYEALQYQICDRISYYLLPAPMPRSSS